MANGHGGEERADEENEEFAVEELYAELRLRLLTGFKRFFAEKRKQGLLGVDALRILNDAADRWGGVSWRRGVNHGTRVVRAITRVER